MGLTFYEAEMYFLNKLVMREKSILKVQINDADYPQFEEIMRKNEHIGNTIAAEFERLKDLGFEKSLKNASIGIEKERGAK